MDPQLASQFVPYHDIAVKIAVSLGVGLLVGLEREWAQKEVGVRTFAIVTLTGTLAVMISPAVVVASMIGVFLLLTFLNGQSMLKDRSLELTTSAALITMVLLGALIGDGHYFTAATAAILVTMLLAWKVELAKFADALLPEEIRGAVLLGLLTFVIYPLLPDRYVDPWSLVNPRQAWVTVVVIAGIGFLNYVLLRLYSTRGLYYAALLGGLVNSTAAVAELSATLRQREEGLFGGAVAVLLLTNVAMFLRNVVLLGIFAPAAVKTAALPLAVMAAAAIGFTYLSREPGSKNPTKLGISSPVSLVRVLKFGGLFLLLSAVGTMAQRQFGSVGFLFVAIIGGMISSASTTATAASLVAAHMAAVQWAALHPGVTPVIDPAYIGITPEIGGVATVLTSIASAMVNMPLVYQQTQQRLLTRRLAILTAAIVGAGLTVLLIGILVQRPGA